jgi:hypothetical protein
MRARHSSAQENRTDSRSSAKGVLSFRLKGEILLRSIASARDDASAGHSGASWRPFDFAPDGQAWRDLKNQDSSQEVCASCDPA